MHKPIVTLLGPALALLALACSSADAPPAAAPAPSATTTLAPVAPVAPVTPAVTPAPTPVDPMLGGDPSGGALGSDGGVISAPGACVVSTPNPTCNTCVQQFCCAQVIACDSDPACVGADNCVTACSQQYGAYPAYKQQCEAQCSQQFAAGAQKLSAVYQCATASCGAQCN